MHIKRGLIIFIILILVVLVLFNIRFLGWAVSNQTTSNVTITVDNHPPVLEDIDDEIYVCEDDQLEYTFYANDSDGDDLSVPAINYWIIPQNPFFLFWVGQSFSSPPGVTHEFIIVSGILDKWDIDGADSGWKTYVETIFVDDNYNSTCCYDTETVNITVIEINHAPTIEDIGVQTVWTIGENSTFYKEVEVSDADYDEYGFGSLIFDLTILNSSGIEVNLFNISDAGVINFTADENTSVGVYNVTLCVQDTGLSTPHTNISDVCGQTGEAFSVCDNFTITVTSENRAPNITAYYPQELNFSALGTQQLYFNITKHDADGTIPDAYWYLNGTLMELDSGSSVDEFSHTFGCGISGNYTVRVDITDGLLNDSLQWNLTIASIACSSPGSSSGGGGGGGAGVVYREFEVEPKFITTTIYHKAGKSFDISITNIGDMDLNMFLRIENLSEKALLNEKNFTLKQGESKIINLYLYALTGADPGVYFGKIIVSNGFSEKEINVVLEIKEKEALFDFKITIPQEYKSVYAGGSVKAIVDVLNVGLYGTAVDVEILLYVLDFDQLVLYESSKEFIAVEKNLSLERALYVPAHTIAGTYLVYGEMKYSNITIETYDTFNVFEKKYVRTSYVLLILAILALIIFIIFLIYKRRKDRRQRGYR